MNDKELREAMAEKGYEMTPDELQKEKRSIVAKFAEVMPEIRGMSTDDALDYITAKVGPHMDNN